MMAYDAAKKSVLVSYLLWGFLGGLGIHNFYNGRTAQGVAQLVLFVLFWVLVWVVIGIIPGIVLAIWLIIDAFLIPGWVQAYNERLVNSLSGQPPLPDMPTPEPVQPSQPILSADDASKKIEALIVMKDKGLLTEEEFAAKRAEILSQLK